MNNWIKVTDMLPTEAGQYIGFAKVKGGTIKTVFYFDWYKFEFIVPEIMLNDCFEVTHWIPLPDDPTPQ